MPRLSEAQLGTAELGEPGAAAPTIDPTNARQRAEAWIKEPFDTRQGGQWDRAMDTLTHNPAIHEAVRETVREAHYVDTATDAQLEKLGEWVQIERRQGESDAHFRKRIKLQLPKNMTGATIPDLIDLSTTMLECDPQNLTLIEEPEVEPARVDIQVEETVFTGTLFTVDEYRDLLQDVKAAGVRLNAVIGEQFTCRSVDDAEQGVNDPDKGYGSRRDPSLGGPYADLITARFDDSGHGLKRPEPTPVEGAVVGEDTVVSDTTTVGR